MFTGPAYRMAHQIGSIRICRCEPPHNRKAILGIAVLCDTQLASPNEENFDHQMYSRCASQEVGMHVWMM